MTLDKGRQATALLLLAGILIPGSAAHAQGEQAAVMPKCIAGGDGTSFWADQVGPDATPRSPEYVATKLNGSYRLLRVETEGHSRKTLREYVLHLQPSDSPSRGNTRQPAVSMPLVGTLQLRRWLEVGFPDVEEVSGAAVSPVEVHYIPERRDLTLYSDPRRLDGGASYQINAIDSTGAFTGRWQDGGNYFAILSTPWVTLLEMHQGYYCAFRE